MDALRKEIRIARQQLHKLKQLLAKHNIKTFINFEEIERGFIFINGFVTCMEQNEKPPPMADSNL